MISSDLMNFFYNPQEMEKSKGKQAELKKLSEIHTRLEAWRKDLPKEMEPKEGALSNVLVMQYAIILTFFPTQLTWPIACSFSCFTSILFARFSSIINQTRPFRRMFPLANCALALLG
jgi:hypothetical protein